MHLCPQAPPCIYCNNTAKLWNLLAFPEWAYANAQRGGETTGQLGHATAIFQAAFGI